MLKLYFSAKIENIYWKIYTENVNKSIYYFPSETNSQNVLMKLAQTNLFEIEETEKINVVDVSDWKFSSKQVQADLKELNQLNVDVILINVTNSFKNKLFDELKISIVKVGNVTRKNRIDLVSYLLKKAKINLDYQTKEALVDLMPDSVGFIENEINKLKLLGKDTYSFDDIQKTVFDTGDTTIFKLIDSWLSGNKNKAVAELNNLLSGNFDILEIVPMFAYKLVQIKLFLQAKQARWSSEMILNQLAIPFWLQNSYANLKPYDKTLDKINDMISKLYNFDINIKKNNTNKKDSSAVPYAQLVKILFE